MRHTLGVVQRNGSSRRSMTTGATETGPRVSDLGWSTERTNSVTCRLRSGMSARPLAEPSSSASFPRSRPSVPVRVPPCWRSHNCPAVYTLCLQRGRRSSAPPGGTTASGTPRGSLCDGPWRACGHGHCVESGAAARPARPAAMTRALCGRRRVARAGAGDARQRPLSFTSGNRCKANQPGQVHP